ncbi:c-type cytochrome [Acetobacter oeni]|uniref:Cytochrome c n=1 Tax=Acetobacter oeni TaxID=304077 RepID=A0A511XGD7_9PROT|nr:cytochrome c [Acetobacter oeni]MBB3881821.1 mono/diheme cytochrome c family protein [Acetobacter oeni]NHO17378.1 c-type cytochrome [Acetobacter oeni]GEN62005.1 cytochrome c [Acetobacter oeni]
MIKRILAIIVGAGIAGGAGFLWYAWYPALPKVAPPQPGQFSAAKIERGRIVAAESYCVECHTRQDIGGGPRLAGDYKMVSPFGAIYSSNITPDPETGIGNWSEEALRRALRYGISRDGSHLLPAFVYDHFTKMTDADISDLYAWIMSQPAVHMTRRPNGFPLSISPRFTLAGWKLLYFRPGVYQPDPKHDAMWNRGAYLAEGAAHCGACHTPRGLLGAEKVPDEMYDGGAVDGWIAPPLNDKNPTPVVWTEDELYDYLRNGVAPLHGPAGGPMSPVAHDFLATVPEEDVHAIAHYFADVDHAAQRVGGDKAALRTAMEQSKRDLAGSVLSTDPDARLYQGACAACHYNAAPMPVLGRPELALNNALWLDEPTNLYLVMLRGLTAEEGQSGVAMPSFYNALSDHDMARIAAYLRRTRTTLPPWTDLDKKAAEARKLVEEPPVNSSH